MDIRLSSPLVEIDVHVRLERRGPRWISVAEVRGERNVGLGRTAHQALAASISFLGPRASAALLADPGLMGASAEMV